MSTILHFGSMLAPGVLIAAGISLAVLTVIDVHRIERWEILALHGLSALCFALALAILVPR